VTLIAMRGASRSHGLLRSVQAPSTGNGQAVETWPEYLRRIARGQTQAQIAARIGITRLSVCNWMLGKSRPKADTAIAVARSYQRSPIEALLAAGYLEPEEVGIPIETRASIHDVPLAQLADEVARRVSENEPSA